MTRVRTDGDQKTKDTNYQEEIEQFTILIFER